MAILKYQNQIIDFANAQPSLSDSTISVNTTFFSGTTYSYQNFTVNAGVTLSIQSGAVFTVNGLLWNKGSIIPGDYGAGAAGYNGGRNDNNSGGGGGGGSAQTLNQSGLATYKTALSLVTYGGGPGGQGGNNGGGGGAGGGTFKIIARKIQNDGTISAFGYAGGGGSSSFNCNDFGGGSSTNGGGGGGGGGAIFIFSEQISGNGTYNVTGGQGGGSGGCVSGNCRGSQSDGCSGGGYNGTDGKVYFAVGKYLNVPISSYPQTAGSAVYYELSSGLFYQQNVGSIIWF